MPRSKTLQAPGPFLALMLKKNNLNPSKISRDIHLSQSAIRLITLGEIKISVQVAFRLAKYFNTNPEYWLAMQMYWDIAEAEKDKELMKIIKSISKAKKDNSPGGQAVRRKAAAKKAETAKKSTAGKKLTRAGKVTAGNKPATARGPSKSRVARTGKSVKPGKLANVKKTASKTGRRRAPAKARQTGRRGRR